MPHPGLTPFSQIKTRTSSVITLREDYQLSVRKTHIGPDQWHVEFLRKIPEYDQELRTEFFLTDQELSAVKEALR